MAMAAGPALQAIGGIIGGFSANRHRKEFEELMGNLRTPDPTTEAHKWFSDLNLFYPQANALSQRARSDELTQNLALREQALPGIGQATRDALGSISPLLRGELPQGVMDAFTRAGGASTVGSGFGGSGFGFLNTGLFGARGALGAIQTGMGLLPSLMNTLPQVSAPTTMGLLGQLMTPSQRVNLGMQLRQQQIGINNTLSSMPTGLDVAAQTVTQMGSSLSEGGMMGMMGGGSGGGGGFGVPQSDVQWGSFGRTQSPWEGTGE